MLTRTLLLFGCLALLPTSGLAWEQGGPTDAGYTEEPIFWNRPNPTRKYELGPIGVTGLVVDIEKDLIYKVRETTVGTPAAGKFKAGEILVGVNGVAFEGRDGQRTLGEALTNAEASDGKLVYEVKDGVATRQVEITIPVLGAYSKTWPLKCAKSDAIIKQATTFYSSETFTKGPEYVGRGLEGAVACLFLLSLGDDAHLPQVKAYLAGVQVGHSNWGNGYNGILCAEYYLRTGDTAVLPLLQGFCDAAKMRQKYNSGWNHGGTGLGPGYTAGGLMNAAGNQILTTLVLASECGANVDQETLVNGLRYLYRFAGHGTNSYGDHRGEGGLGSNGKDGMLAAAMQVATGASGDVSIYQKARDYLAMSIATSYPVATMGHADEGRGDAIWRSITSCYLLDSKPEIYHESMDHLRWWYDLCRRPAGSFGVSLTAPRFNTEASGAAIALAYTAPRKTLCITGAPRSAHAKKFSLPSELFGTKADLVFLSIEPIERFYKLAPEEPIYRPLYRFGSAYGQPRFDAKTIKKEEILKWIGHPNYLIRAQAAKALRIVGGPAEIEKLLDDADPRVRRAGLDGWIDYNYWFGPGKAPMKGSEITPAMLKSVRRMLADPDEAWWVVDGALTALCFAPAEVVRESLPLIEPWAKHQEWWLRQSAFFALSAFAQDDKLLVENMPLMFRILAHEGHMQARSGMTAFFSQQLKKNPNNEIGRQIVNSLLKAVDETTIIPDKDGNLRSIEGKFNVGMTLTAAAQASEAETLRVARAITENFDVIGTPEMISMLSTPNHNALNAGRPGVYATLKRLPEDHAKELKDLLEAKYLPELVRRWQGDKQNAELVNTIADLDILKRPEAGWRQLDSTPQAERVWRFTTFDVPDATKANRTAGGLLRNPPMSVELKDWARPEYDDSAWSNGPAPIGAGVFEWKGSKTVYANRSAWGEGEFILARVKFDYDGRNFAALRLSVLAPRSYSVYLNGKPIHSYIWWQKTPAYMPIILSEQQTKFLEKGVNVLAIYGNRTDQRGPAQLDAVIEGLVPSDVVR